jgi:solute carrier family 25 protein 33/36
MRTRLRQPPDADGKRKYRNLFQGARLIFKEEGLAGLYGGCAPHLMRVVPNAGIMFLTYEVVSALE